MRLEPSRSGAAVTSFFGLPIGRLALLLAIALGAGLLLLTLLALRHAVLFKLGIRNIGRRKTQTALIASGLMLSTMLITAALGVGDVIGGTIQAVAVGTLGRVDEIAYSDYSHTPFAITRFEQAASALRRGAAIAGAMPETRARGQLIADLRSRQIVTVDLIGVPAAIPPVFGSLHGPGAALIDPAALGPGDVLLNPRAAEALGPRKGDLLYLFRNGTRTVLHVRALVRAPGITGINPTAIMGLDAMATLLGRPGQADAIVVANQGTANNSVDGTDAAIATLVAALPDFNADPVKRDGIERYARAQDIFSRVFLLFTLFAVGISLLLILLVFTLLAAERRAEMGVARAIGATRGHVVQTFLFEGAAYDLVAAAIGVAAGLAIGSGLTAIISRQLTALSVTTAGQVQSRSLAVAYSLGALCTGITITLAAWFIGRLNIVAAIRGVPDDRRDRGAMAALRRARRALLLAGRSLIRPRPILAARALFQDLPLALLALCWRVVMSGIPVLAPGLWLLRTGLDAMDPLRFAIGVTASITGAMLLIRLLLKLARAPARVADRLACAPGGLLLLGYWALPFTQLDAWGWPRFTDGVEVFFVAGAMMVAGAVLVAIYTIDLPLHPMLGALTLIGHAATIRAALAYVLQYKGRSGLALAMFSLVAFTLTLMAVIIGATTRGFDLAAAGNGFDLSGQSAFGSIGDVDRAVRGLPYLPRGTLARAGSAAISPVGVRQPGISPAAWSIYALNQVSDGFLDGTTLRLSTRAAGYASDAAVWRAVRTRPNLAVIDSGAVLSLNGYAAAPPPEVPAAYLGAGLFVLQGVHAEDHAMAPLTIGLGDPKLGIVLRLTVIGVVDSRAYNTYGIITRARNITAAGFPSLTPTIYYFKAADGVDAGTALHRVESAYLDHGLQLKITANTLNDSLGPKIILAYVLQGFVALTLLMGVAALGLIAARAVVERRHSVGTMRALGYTRWMVGMAFLVEQLFTAALGLTIGGALGLVLSKNLFDANFFEQYRTGMTFVIPWPSLAIIACCALVATLIATMLPAWQASRITPAEALRYE